MFRGSSARWSPAPESALGAHLRLLQAQAPPQPRPTGAGARMALPGRLSLALLLAAAIVPAGCGLTQVRLNPTLLDPAASGRLHIGHTPAGDTTVLLQVRALAPPGTLTPPRKAYVVWIAGLTNGAPKDAGLLHVGPRLRATLRTTTPLRYFDLFVTAEDRAHPPRPTGPEVLRASVSGG